MRALKLDAWLQCGQCRVALYTINDRTWFLGSDLATVLKRDVHALIGIAPGLFTTNVSQLAKINSKGHERRFFNVTGARVLAAMTPSKTGQDLFNLLCVFETDQRKLKRNSRVRNGR